MTSWIFGRCRKQPDQGYFTIKRPPRQVPVGGITICPNLLCLKSPKPKWVNFPHWGPFFHGPGGNFPRTLWGRPTTFGQLSPLCNPRGPQLKSYWRGERGTQGTSSTTRTGTPLNGMLQRTSTHSIRVFQGTKGKFCIPRELIAGPGDICSPVIRDTAIDNSTRYGYFQEHTAGTR